MNVRRILAFSALGALVATGCESRYEEHDTTGIPEQTDIGAAGGLGSPGKPGAKVTVGGSGEAGAGGVTETDLGYPVRDDKKAGE